MFRIPTLYRIFTFSILSVSLVESRTGILKNILQNEVDGVKITATVTVSKDGFGNFTRINDAVAVAPNNSKGYEGYFHIKIMEGVYEEYIVIGQNKRYLMMNGVGINRTIITGNHSYVDGWKTMYSATFTASGRNFICLNMTIRNTAGPTKEQAVALLCNGDFSIFYRCSIEGYQDTLYVHSKKQFYRECDIYGTTDFIFGSHAAVVLQKCNLYARRPRKGHGNEITAQGRTVPKEESGIVIQGCTIKATNDLARSNYTVKTYGRPWKKYSRTIVMQTYIDGFLEPAGWNKFSGAFALKTLYYAEYNNTGPGSNVTNRVTWPSYHIINATVALNFTVSRFIEGNSWIPQTNVPYVGGLIP